MFGNYVPTEEPCWYLILELKELVELAFAAHFREDDIVYFDPKITAHNALFDDLFPDER